MILILVFEVNNNEEEEVEGIDFDPQVYIYQDVAIDINISPSILPYFEKINEDAKEIKILKPTFKPKVLNDVQKSHKFTFNVNDLAAPGNQLKLTWTFFS